MKRFLYGTPAALGLATTGFVLLGLLAARFLVHSDDGFSSGATVGLASLVGATIGFGAGVVLAARLPEPRLLALSILGVLSGTTSVGLLTWFAAQRAAKAEEVISAIPAPVPAPRVLPPAPPLPPSGTPDSLVGLVAVAPDSVGPYEMREISYESPGIAVYGRQRDWFLVGLSTGGRAWLHTSLIRRYHAIENLVLNRQNYLTEDWAGFLHDLPSESSPATNVSHLRKTPRVPASVVEATRIGSVVWLKVEILDRDPCDGTGTPRAAATGWIPVWSSKGNPTAWYYSRGC